MKRTTIYLEPDLEVRLKLEVQRRNQPMALLVREAVEAYLTKTPGSGPPGGGAFSSGRDDTAERVDDVLEELGFGEGSKLGSKRTPNRRRSRRRA